MIQVRLGDLRTMSTRISSTDFESVCFGKLVNIVIVVVVACWLLNVLATC